MVVGSLGLAFLAGLLTVLSPCVLPLLPIVLGSAAAEHRRRLWPWPEVSRFRSSA